MDRMLKSVLAAGCLCAALTAGALAQSTSALLPGTDVLQIVHAVQGAPSKTTTIDIWHGQGADVIRIISPTRTISLGSVPSRQPDVVLNRNVTSALVLAMNRFKNTVPLNAEHLSKYNDGKFAVSFVNRTDYVLINITVEGAPPKMPPTTIDGCGFGASYRVNKATLRVTKVRSICS